MSASLRAPPPTAPSFGASECTGAAAMTSSEVISTFGVLGLGVGTGGGTGGGSLGAAPVTFAFVLALGASPSFGGLAGGGTAWESGGGLSVGTRTAGGGGRGGGGCDGAIS